MRWIDRRMKELEAKDKANWDTDDWEAYYYCQECYAEDERDAEYMSSYMVFG